MAFDWAHACAVMMCIAWTLSLVAGVIFFAEAVVNRTGWWKGILGLAWFIGWIFVISGFAGGAA